MSRESDSLSRIDDIGWLQCFLALRRGATPYSLIGVASTQVYGACSLDRQLQEYST